MSSKQQCGRTSTMKGEHISHGLLLRVLVLLFAFFVRQQFAVVVTDYFVLDERSRHLDAASATWQVADDLQSDSAEIFST